MSLKIPVYHPRNHVRILTATSLFDGHDATINIMRRIIQASGAEVIHIGHNRSATEIVQAAIQEDVQAIAVTSYQGGHMEFFRYLHDHLRENQASHIRIFGGGGGVILPDEIRELHQYGIARIFSPDDGREMGLQGMINHLLAESDFPVSTGIQPNNETLILLKGRNHRIIAQLITTAEIEASRYASMFGLIKEAAGQSTSPVIGITGTGGSGKSSIVDEVVLRFREEYTGKTVAIISVDPSRRKTGGALLADRIRMNAIDHPSVYMRSMATRQANLALSKYIRDALDIVKAAGFDLIILETSGIGQSDTEITDHSNYSVYVMTPEYGAAIQLEKIDMLDYADLVVINKFDHPGARDALRDVKKQYQRNHGLFEKDPAEMPVFGTIASQYNDEGINHFFRALMAKIGFDKLSGPGKSDPTANPAYGSFTILPPGRKRYLSEISEIVRNYNNRADHQASVARKLNAVETVSAIDPVLPTKEMRENLIKQLDPENLDILNNWDLKKDDYQAEKFTYKVRGRDISVDNRFETLSHLKVPKIAIPGYSDKGDILRWVLRENFPGEFPFAAGVYPFKRQEEDPIRMFAGEGSPERTNSRFHYVSLGSPVKRLSTAYDSVTLYGEDPDLQPDIYGKTGNSGVSVCCLDDCKKLYSGFDLCDPATSVSMTINGPAPTMVAFFLNTAIDQECEKYIRGHDLMDEVSARLEKIYENRGIQRPVYRGSLPPGNDGLGLLLLGVTGDLILPPDIYQKIKAETLSRIRGTIQADILKEDQAQNTCIFSTAFALRMMSDIQEYFISKHVRNFYSVSISGYHIAEAGANPITQLAFTLANGFTYVEYFLARGMNIKDFAHNLSFFFSNGLDAEYSVIGRVARTIWAKAMKYRYGADLRSQMLKYHIQTSGRSLHAQEVDFNDIRTTLQALNAVYDNCNSLHTNAFDEAITTPTEESVRRAIAIQMIINNEFGLAKNQNPLQGSFIIEELTDLVEEAVLMEFDRITERGGVLGAMETGYQRGKIQEESLWYERLKDSGQLPIIGVNTFLSSKGSPTVIRAEVIRSTEEEKQNQLMTVKNLHRTWESETPAALARIKETVAANCNTFEILMESCKVCSIGQITHSLYRIGGRYRRNM
ncbi:MAG: methylmalonyl-CoA mutase [Porphyromonadaceae bacterium]|nr:MAG: methylmalonyl-CoA mutase [Porphyromonadaceae bacterium]